MYRVTAIIAALLAAVQVQAAELGDDGLHKASWMRDTFRDLGEDLAEANAEGKRLVILIEQNGCIYCKRMHENTFSEPEVEAFIEDNFFVIQLNLYGDIEVTDFDGTVLPEKDMARRWGLMFTPSMIFLPEEVPDDAIASQVAVAFMPGAFEYGTTIDLFNWVVEKGYNTDESFQRYHMRMVGERGYSDIKP